MFSFFKRKPEPPDLSNAPRDFSFLGTDIHSHLIPGIDDGSPDLETSLTMIRRLQELGYSKLIIISLQFGKLKAFLADKMPEMELEFAAEYYLDNSFMSMILPQGLLPFGKKKYVLVEVSMAGWPRQFSDIIFTIQSQGLVPVLAHPERYLFEDNIKVYEEWKSKGLLLQMNLLAVSGYYGLGVKTAALRYLEHGLYDFCGTDAHHLRHLDAAARMALEQPEIMLKLAEYPHWKNSSL
jgi:tyrosine-protein phosphatase YwqE